jgi:plastocyanin domain-containing protein
MLRGMRIAAIVIAAAALVAGCDKKKDAEPTKPAQTAPLPPAADGTRRVAVTVDNKGYTPGEITAKPNEKLILVVTRTVDGECLSKIVVGDQPPVELPINKPTDIAVTAPASGKLGFACGMDMFHGTIVVGS